MSERRKVAVIGAGVVGISSAVNAIERVPNIEVTLISETFSPFTTGDGSAGLLQPAFLSVKTIDSERLRSWFKNTFDFFNEISKSVDANEYGVGLLSCYQVSTTPVHRSLISDVYLDWRPMSERELSLFPSHYKYGEYNLTYFVECSKLLPMLLKRFKSKGGKIINRRIEDLSKLHGEYDVVINCTGLGAANITNDPELHPIRGQVFRVKAPWIKYAVMDEEFYIIPNTEDVICGGTKQVGNWSRDINSDDSKRIMKGCTDLIPSLKNAKVLREWVGLRPGRKEVRLERETLQAGNGTLEVIHNYGHGGSGITLGWGTAHEAVSLLESALNDIYLKNLQAHL